MEFGLTDPLFACRFHICQVWGKPDIVEQLSNSKPGQRRRDGSQTHLAMCKLYLCLLQRLYHPSLSVQLDPNPTDSTPPWAKSPHLYLPQFWPIWQFLVPAKESGQLDLGQEIYWILFKGRSFLSPISKSNSWKAFNKKRITLYSVWKAKTTRIDL